MKLCISDEEWKKKYSKPYRWFAWYPVNLDDGSVVWLEHVLRCKALREYNFWEYSPLKKSL